MAQVDRVLDQVDEVVMLSVDQVRMGNSWVEDLKYHSFIVTNLSLNAETLTHLLTLIACHLI